MVLLATAADLGFIGVPVAVGLIVLAWSIRASAAEIADALRERKGIAKER